ncbi:hypothetical protein BDN70DRAFT_697364 [Pholiota conissans]|uniref:Tetraspanin n=1 Tax=Pholiota conissans TaxID=109636 RepID=A0A9P6D0H7_9AGAR|nr:hypothetical protein BDN70DRAFT_697364 [Pholiota conissans]
MYLDPPNPPFNHRESSGSTLQGDYGSPISSLSRRNSLTGVPDNAGLSTADSSVSLTVNYLPTKFSNPQLNQLAQRKRRPHHRSAKHADDLSPGAGVMPKMGGGVDAFRSGEARMNGEDEDEDGDNERVEDGSRSRWTKKPAKRSKPRWNRFKWTLFIANLFLTIYSFIGLIGCLLTWFNVWSKADIIRVANNAELTTSTVAAAIGIFTCLLGWAGILLNNRSFLAVYCLLTWITFLFLLIPGYLSYKRRAFNLEGKVNAQWSQDLGAEGRLRIQNELACCGYFSPFVEATISQTCYARSMLPGCKLKFLDFERQALKYFYSVAFGLVPLQLFVMIAGLLCSNHVTYRFGKGMMPKAYRLSMTSMAIIMDNYASQLAEQYGENVAAEILTRSRSDLQLSAMPKMPYAPPVPAKAAPSQVYTTTRYDAVHTKPPGPGYI